MNTTSIPRLPIRLHAQAHYRVSPKAGWGWGPNNEDVLGEDERRVISLYDHSAESIYRDYAAIVLKDSTANNPRNATVPLFVQGEPYEQYFVRLYLNNPASQFEECTATDTLPSLPPGDCRKCFDLDPSANVDWRCLPEMDSLLVRVNGSNWAESDQDQTYHVCTGGDGLIQIDFRHTGDHQQARSGKWLDNLIYCYGVEARPVALGGGPEPLGSTGTKDFYVKVNGVQVAADTMHVLDTSLTAYVDCP